MLAVFLVQLKKKKSSYFCWFIEKSHTNEEEYYVLALFNTSTLITLI